MNTSEIVKDEVQTEQADSQQQQSDAQNETTAQQSQEPIARRVHRKPEKERGPFFVIRQILNIIFIILGVAGCFYYVKINEQMGIILFIIAMAFKMAECMLRFKK